MKNTQPSTINNHRVSSAPPGLCNGSGVLTSRPENSSASGVGPSRGFGHDRPDRSPQRIAKAQAFHALIQERRKDKTRCGRCGGPRGQQFRNCDTCREKLRRAKLRSKGWAVLPNGEYTVAELAGMVLQVRREMDAMQKRFKLWQKAADYRRNLHYRTNRLRRKYHQPVPESEAMDYLAGTNHAYDPQAED